MNANELADELDKYLKGEEYDRLVWEAPTMLRQQADELIDAGGMISMLREKLAQQTKPLSKEEIDDLVHEHNLLDDYPYDFVRAIEERHGIK